ncbi:MAG TPA: MOSC N-terminal beta barrel domain-containing protein [Acidimicrobiales bacterium]|nr:MOSC N-terminal beta barrel domain-containing protein [Acidimicrobiales bacterium]
MEPIGRVRGLWRYPVKSMQGERVEAVDVGDRGVRGDRHFAVMDRRTGKVLSAKTEPALLSAAAVLAGVSLAMRLPNGETVLGAGPSADTALSAWLGRPVHLEECGPDERGVVETPETPEGDGPLHEFRTPPGSFVDAQPLHLLSTADLDGWDVRRFRPNLLVDGPVELGMTLAIGSVQLLVGKPATRCVIVTREQPGGVARDLGVARALRSRDLCLGVYARVVQGGRIEQGDQIRRIS